MQIWHIIEPMFIHSQNKLNLKANNYSHEGISP